MAWSSLFRPSAGPAESGGVAGSPSMVASEPTDALSLARTRARRRLVGAVVLLVIGVLGFPLVFETQPRPIPVDIPIEIPRRENAPPLVMPGPAPSARATDPVLPAARLDEPTTAAPDPVITESREEAAGTPPPLRPATPSTLPTSSTPTSRTADASGARSNLPAATTAGSSAAAANRASSEPRRSVAEADAARAKALLAGQTVASPSAPTASGGSRFIVQVGAFAESDAAQDARARLERIGLKTYTQVANTPSGPRIRVRLGPFGSRDEADRALAKARGAGLSPILQVL